MASHLPSCARRWRFWLILVAVAVLSAEARPQPAHVATTDGLALDFNAQGDVALLLNGKPLPRLPLPGGFYVAEVAQAGTEIIKNGSLEEDADGNGIPDGFLSGPYWSRDNTVSHTGRWAMKCEIPATQDKVSGSFGIVAPVKGGATYLLSFWLKAKGRAGRSAASCGYVQQQDDAGRRTTETFQHMMNGGVSGDSDWKRVSLLLTTEPATRNLYFRTDIYRGHGTLWADDFGLIELGAQAKPFPTTIRTEAGKVLQQGADKARALSVEASWEPAGEMLRLSGHISDASGKDRCLVVSYRLPLNAVGGVWGNDIVDKVKIPPTGRSSRVASWGQFGPFSVYPFSSVVLPDASAGISLSVPMHPAQPFRLAYAGDEGLLVEWLLALTPRTAKFPQSASFSATLYAHDPAWGFRAAAEKYYKLFPDYFTVRCPRQGNWYYHDLSKLPNPEDFGLMFNEMVERKTIAEDHKRGCLNFSYTEPWGWWGWAVGLHPKEDEPPTPKDEVLRHIRDLAAQVPAGADTHNQTPSLSAQTILNSGVFGAEGEYATEGYVARWGGYNWALNPAPDAVPPGQFSRFEATYLWEIEPKLALGADGIYLDSVVNSWTALPNYRPDHLARPDYPLTFSFLDRRPAQLGVWNQYEFIERLSKDLHSRGKHLMANIFPYNWVFFDHWLDVMGHEVWSADDPQKMRAQRTLAYHKPYTWLMQLKSEVPAAVREKWMRQAMSYGIFPNIVGGSSDPKEYERFRPLFKKYMPAIIAMAEAGWEPVTHATCNAPGVCVERFGPKDGRLFFSVRNDGEKPATARLSIVWNALALQPQTSASRIPEDEKLALDAGAIMLQLNPGEVTAFRFDAVPR